MKKIIALNLKAYKESAGENGLRLCKVAGRMQSLFSSSGKFQLIVAPQPADLHYVAKELQGTGVKVYAQHCDEVKQGAFTGWTSVESLKEAGCSGTILNHSEHKIPVEKIQAVLNMAHAHSFETILCADDLHETKKLSALKPHPTMIAVEPPELIGSGISVSTAKPEVVTGSVEIVKKTNPEIIVLCGAGVSNAHDFAKALELGSEGVLLASAFVKAQDPEHWLKTFVSIL
jgi:triosephosphate isomerase